MPRSAMTPERANRIATAWDEARTYEMTLERAGAGKRQSATPCVYLACPYSATDEDLAGVPQELVESAVASVRQRRFEAVTHYAARMHAAGWVYYSPITASHPVAETTLVPNTCEAWLPFDLEILERCDWLWVLRLPGWDRSIGVAKEIERAEQLSLPITYVDPDQPVPKP